MTERPREVTAIHTRLLKCALEVEDARAYWRHVEPGSGPVDARHAFESFWFGSRSLARVKVLLINLRARFEAYPEALAVLHRWSSMAPETRTLICHWHLQLADPLYRAFTGQYLVQRIEELRPEVSRDLVIRWVGDQGPGRWTMNTRVQFASKLLSAAYSAGLVRSRKDPRPLRFPRVPDEALSYLLYLLRGVDFEGELLNNPYLASVGLAGSTLHERLRQLGSLRFRSMSGLVDYGWCFKDLEGWFSTLSGGNVAMTMGGCL